MKKIERLSPDQGRRVLLRYLINDKIIVEVVPSRHGFRIHFRPPATIKGNPLIAWNAGHYLHQVNALLEHAFEAAICYPLAEIPKQENLVRTYASDMNLIEFFHSLPIKVRLNESGLDAMQLQFALKYQTGQFDFFEAPAFNAA